MSGAKIDHVHLAVRLLFFLSGKKLDFVTCDSRRPSHGL